MLSEGSSVKGSPEDKQPSGPFIKGSAKISRGVTLALYTGPACDGFEVLMSRWLTLTMFTIFMKFVFVYSAQHMRQVLLK